MRGMDEMQESLFTVSKLEDFVPAGPSVAAGPAGWSTMRSRS